MVKMHKSASSWAAPIMARTAPLSARRPARRRPGRRATPSAPPPRAPSGARGSPPSPGCPADGGGRARRKGGGVGGFGVSQFWALGWRLIYILGLGFARFSLRLHLCSVHLTLIGRLWRVGAKAPINSRSERSGKERNITVRSVC